MSKSYCKDLTGKKFGRLTVVEFIPTEDSNSHWKCKCDCGKETIVRQTYLKTGHTVSCGCRLIELNHNIKDLKFSHGLCRTRLYQTWCNMIKRCYNPHQQYYKDYGERGIIVCDEWRNDFKSFYDWAMSNGYADNLTIDRIDVNGNYEPSNCRWTDAKTQARNTRRNVVVEYQGQNMTLAEAAETSGIYYNTLSTRYHRGDRGERLFRPVK